jgi:alanyl-tRNA synthetase
LTLSDSASSSGVRRIEALTGQAALNYLREQAERVSELSGALKTQPSDLVGRVQGLMDERKKLENEVAQLRRELAMSGGGQAEAKAEDVNGVPFLAQVLSGVTGKDLPSLIDAHKEKLGSAAILLIADADGKVAVAAGVTKDLTDKVSAVDLVKAAVVELGGKGGGGRPDMAQGGAKDAANADGAIAAAKAAIGG